MKLEKSPLILAISSQKSCYSIQKLGNNTQSVSQTADEIDGPAHVDFRFRGRILTDEQVSVLQQQWGLCDFL